MAKTGCAPVSVSRNHSWIGIRLPLVVSLVSAIVLLFCPIEALSQDRIGQDRPRASDIRAEQIDNSRNDNKKAVEALVEQLASPNPAPLIDRNYDPREPGVMRYPKDYDKEAQWKVFATCKSLVTLGADAIPGLIAHLDDKRYCYTFRSGPGEPYNRTVGQVCAEMLGNQINAYQPLARPKSTGKKLLFFPDATYDRNQGIAGGGPAKWIAERRGKELWELQVEAARWAIDFEKKRGTGANEPHPFGRMIAGTKEELERTVHGLEVFVELLQATRKAAPVVPRLPEGVVDPDTR